MKLEAADGEVEPAGGSHVAATREGLGFIAP